MSVALSAEQKTQLEQLIKDNVEKLVDKKLAEHASSVLNTEVRVEVVRKVRQALGLRKSPGRGKSQLVATSVAAVSEPAVA